MPEETAESAERWSRRISHQADNFQDDEIPAPDAVLIRDGSELALQAIGSPKDGDAVYCHGVRVGTFHGNYSKPGEWYIDVLPSKEQPPELAERLQGQAKTAATDKQD
jgi:hypothetical protein